MSGEIPDIKAKITFEDSGASATLDKVAQSATATGTATKAVGEAAKAAVPNVGQFGSTVGLAGQAVGKLNPALGQTISVAAASLGSIQALMTAGMGPLGLAVAGISIGITAATAAMNLYTQSNKEAEAAAKSLSEALEANEYALTSIMAEQAKHRAEIQARIHVASADATTDELLAERQRLNDELALMRGTALEGSAQMTDVLRQRLDLEERLTVEAVQARADRVYAIESKAARNVADAWIAAAVQQAEDKREGTGAYAPRPRAGGRRRRSLEDLMGGGGAPIRELAGERTADDTGLTGPGKDDIQARYAEEQELANERYQEQLDRNLEYLEKREEQERESAEKLKEIHNSVFSAIEAGLQSSVDAWLSGSATAGEAAMQMVRGVAKALTTEAIIQGLKETALGIGDVASYNYVGAAQHFAAAGTWAAVGVAAGAVGAVSGAFGGASGGGAAQPRTGGGPELSGGARERGGDTYIVNVGSSGLVYAADRDQLGRDLDDYIQGARARRA